MSEDTYDKKSHYNNILNRLQKKYSVYEGLLLIRKQYLTNNILYYFLCAFFRFIFILSISGDYNSFFMIRGYAKSFQKFLKVITCHNLLSKINISFLTYCLIVLIIIIIVAVIILMNIYTLKQLRKYKYTGKWPIPNKLEIIIGHINFLLFPFIIEFLSFSYYIYFFPNKFIIKLNIRNEKYILIFIMIINTILIIIYNIDNYIWIYCSNKLSTVTVFEANLRQKKNKKINFNDPISYRCSKLGHFILIFVQNVIIFSNIQEYINGIRYKIIFIVINSLLMFVSIIIFYVNKMNTFNYLNYVNTFINVLFLLSLYSIIFDLILYLIRYRIKSVLKEIIYLLIKAFLALITYSLYVYKSHKFLESKICEILFQEKNIKREKHFVNSFYLLHQIMLLIKENNKIESAYSLFQFLNKHINDCNKINCNCKILEVFGDKNFKNKTNNVNDERNFLSDHLNLLNYLFESAFVEGNFYNNYDLSIILAEHFCHLKNNPIMAFSIVNTLILKNRSQFSIFEMVILYELNQKYIYFIKARADKNIEEEIIADKKELLKYNDREKVFKSFYSSLILSNKIKTIMNNYIDNIIKILSYKNIFDDSITYQLDESNENIISAKIKFFEQSNEIENISSNFNNKFENNKFNKIKINDQTNLYIIIYLLKKEQLYYSKLINSVERIKISKNLPIFFIFKYFIYFDFFSGGKIPEKIVKKLLFCLGNITTTNLYNSTITRNEYSILKRKYQEQNNKIDSKIYVIVDFKKELRTKYITEEGALKLGYKQIDVINEKIDILMPSDFCKSHQNALKHLIIGCQLRYGLAKQSYYFNKGNTILYPAYFEGAIIYNLSKYLIMMLESYLLFENEYRFMLNNNFELLANSKNFEYEYCLNKKILELFSIDFLDLIKIKPEKIKKHFEKEYKKIQYEKFVQQVKIQDYLIPELYVPPGETISSVVRANNFNHSKNNVLSKILHSNNKEENNYENGDNKNEYDDEKNNLIQKETIKNNIYEMFISPREVVFHKTYNIIINKGIFIDNLYKVLAKIPENDFKIENDKVYYNLILSAKKLISNLRLRKKEFSNNYIKISITFSFYYDKPFFFISIDDEKKLYIKTSNNINFENNYINQLSSSLIMNNIPYNKNDKKSRNKENIKKKISLKKINKTANNDDSNSQNNSNTPCNKNLNKRKSESRETLHIIDKNKKEINKAKFIRIIKFVLSFIIILIILIYIIIINVQKHLIEKMELILLAYYYNLFTKNLFLGVYSILLNTYYELFLFENKDYSINYYILYTLTNNIKERYHNYTIYFYEYNLAINHDINIIFNKRNFTKLRGFWQEITYESDYSMELDYVIYNILFFNSSELLTSENSKDFQNFLYFRDKSKVKEKVNCAFVKLLYYLCSNHEFVYKGIYKDIESSIFNSYIIFVNKQSNIIILSEIIGLLLYIIFFSTVFLYLYFSNTIIIKNIIFLFLDYNEENHGQIKINNTNKINLKIIEFQNIINDFNLNLFERFGTNIDNLNNNKYIKSINKNNSNSLSTDSESISIGNNFTKKLSKRYHNFKGNNLSKPSNKNLIEKHDNKNNANILSDLKKKSANNSSLNYLVESNSQFFKDNLANNSINGSKDILSSKNDMNNINAKNIISKHSLNNNNSSDHKIEEKINRQDILLNNSNKSLVLMIKIYFIIIALLLIVAIIFIILKFIFMYSYNNKFKQFFSDLTVLTDRYMQVYYYFNILRTLLIFPEGSKKKKFEDILENIHSFYEEENNKFNELLTYNIYNYPETLALINKMRDNKNNSTNAVKETVCKEDLVTDGCSLYLDSDYNIFDSGIELGFSSSMSEIYNFFMGYKKLNNKQSISDIKNNIIFFPNSKFIHIMTSLNFFYVYIEEKIFLAFEKDEANFNKSYFNTTTLLNIISIIFSILTFFFVIIFIFISISEFTRPIKDATYRINCSFYHIQKYSLIDHGQL